MGRQASLSPETAQLPRDDPVAFRGCSCGCGCGCCSLANPMRMRVHLTPEGAKNSMAGIGTLVRTCSPALPTSPNPSRTPYQRFLVATRLLTTTANGWVPPCEIQHNPEHQIREHRPVRDQVASPTVIATRFPIARSARSTKAASVLYSGPSKRRTLLSAMSSSCASWRLQIPASRQAL